MHVDVVTAVLLALFGVVDTGFGMNALVFRTTDGTSTV